MWRPNGIRYLLRCYPYHMTVTRSEAIFEFDQARRKARRELWASRLSGSPIFPLSFDELKSRLDLRTPLYQGIEVVSLDNIVGSVGRFREFTRQFWPLDASLKERWAAVWKLAMTGGWTPVELYQVGNVYLVRNGNHRVSVARALANVEIEAHVWRFPDNIEIHANDTLEALLERHGRKSFLAQTNLDQLRPDHSIQMTIPGFYPELLAQIEEFRLTLAEIDNKEMLLYSAVAAWYDMLYLPVTQIVHESGVLSRFPRRTETDIYVWLSANQAELAARYGNEASLFELAQQVAAEFGENRIEQIARQLRTWLEATSLSGGKQPDQPLWEMAKEARRHRESLDGYSHLDKGSRVMLSKSYTKSGKFCRVTFRLPAEVNAETASLCGEFNNWDSTVHEMKKLKDDSFSLTITLPAGETFRYRFLLDGERWENDWAADAYSPNALGSEDSVIEL